MEISHVRICVRSGQGGGIVVVKCLGKLICSIISELILSILLSVSPRF